jgi:hypothetical protein
VHLPHITYHIKGNSTQVRGVRKACVQCFQRRHAIAGTPCSGQRPGQVVGADIPARTRERSFYILGAGSTQTSVHGPRQSSGQASAASSRLATDWHPAWIGHCASRQCKVSCRPHEQQVTGDLQCLNCSLGEAARCLPAGITVASGHKARREQKRAEGEHASSASRATPELLAGDLSM